MYGTIAIIRLKPGTRDQVLEKARQYSAEPDPGSVGEIVYALDGDPDGIAFAVAFESRETYIANAQRPETHARYQELMAYAAGEPVWHDGEVALTLGVAASARA
jgi:hypothetical protein